MHVNSLCVFSFSPQPLVKFKSHLYYEDKDNIQESLNNLKPLPGSKVYFFKNGECQGLAFEDIYQGSYYPSVSLHKNATVSVNFGPNFKFPPSNKYCYRPVSKSEKKQCLKEFLRPLLIYRKNFFKTHVTSEV